MVKLSTVVYASPSKNVERPIYQQAESGHAGNQLMLTHTQLISAAFPRHTKQIKKQNNAGEKFVGLSRRAYTKRINNSRA